MKVERRLAVYGDRETLNTLICRLEETLSDGWSRDREREQLALFPYPHYCFLCSSHSECSPFLLLLATRAIASKLLT